MRRLCAWWSSRYIYICICACISARQNWSYFLCVRLLLETYVSVCVSFCVLYTQSKVGMCVCVCCENSVRMHIMNDEHHYMVPVRRFGMVIGHCSDEPNSLWHYIKPIHNNKCVYFRVCMCVCRLNYVYSFVGYSKTR